MQKSMIQIEFTCYSRDTYYLIIFLQIIYYFSSIIGINIPSFFIYFQGNPPDTSLPRSLLAVDDGLQNF